MNFIFSTKAVAKRLLWSIGLCLMLATQVAIAQTTTTVALPGAIGPNSYVDITPGGGFPAGGTLTAITLTISSYTASGSSEVSDFVVAVAPTTPNSSNATFFTSNTGGSVGGGTSQGWPGTPTVSTKTIAISPAIALTGMKLYVGNAWGSATGTWNGSISFTYTGAASATNSVPTLSEYGQFALVSLMIVAGIASIRRKQG